MFMIKSIVIAGGGTAGWMTAAALARVFGPSLNITLVESDEIGTIGVGEATIPAIARFNTMLRLDEDAFLRETQGTFKLGIEFRGWRERGHSYMHSFGAVGRDLAYLPFHHYWYQDRMQGGDAGELGDYDLNHAAAYAGRFARADDLVHAFHFDAGLYAAFLRRYAEAGGVTRIEGRIADVTVDGDIRSLRLADGREIAGDFFIDCTGFRALLIEGALKTGYEDWRHWLPCDRALAVPSARTGALLPYTRATAQVAGWTWRIPLQHRTGNGHVYCSAHTSDDEAHAALMGQLDGEALADPRPIRFTTGRRKKLWHRNCLAIGLSAGFIEPLESTSIHLIQSAIERFIMLFPRGPNHDRLAEDFNNSSIMEMENIRDFIILHYHVNGRYDETFWNSCRNMTVPDSLHHRIELFRETAALHIPTADIFRLPSWLQVLHGQGVEPQAVHPFTERVARDDRARFLRGQRHDCRERLKHLPSLAG
ncbi:tryptophan halogenase [Asticcacaulis sp. AC460]|nr:tryptophan halogenase [Asticcacaulis sp. AC460]